MMDVAKAYGDALYEVAAEEGAAERVRESLAVLKSVLADNPDVLALMDAPALRKQQRVDAVSAMFDGAFHHLVQNSLKLAAEYRAAAQLPEAIRQFERRWEESHGIAVAEVVSAIPLTQAQETQLTHRLERTTGRQIRLSKTVDPACVGGLRLKVGGRQMDGTVQNRLRRIQHREEAEG